MILERCRFNALEKLFRHTLTITHSAINDGQGMAQERNGLMACIHIKHYHLALILFFFLFIRLEHR